MTNQLDFFDLLKPTAKLLPFPPRRIHSLVNAAAARVHAAAQADQAQAMLNEVGKLMLRYLLHGFDEDTAYGLAMGYQNAIQAEIHRLRWSGSRPDPRGVA
ncbi:MULTISPECIES: DUF6074 family protein [unclassified Rhizobium]|nr:MULTISPECIES: DUF6074 family protein [unclassified Rhizobium]MDH7805727.1 hypothetical protein [Rhizobium sp. AN67]MDQ4407201.1 DUF6074 family protein [Rhizobium sp. AN63]SOD59775.1 hypothetical protein SAMN05216595_4947 [Rhizobium sp. AN6A]